MTDKPPSIFHEAIKRLSPLHYAAFGIFILVFLCGNTQDILLFFTLATGTAIIFYMASLIIVYVERNYHSFDQRRSMTLIPIICAVIALSFMGKIISPPKTLAPVDMIAASLYLFACILMTQLRIWQREHCGNLLEKMQHANEEKRWNEIQQRRKSR